MLCIKGRTVRFEATTRFQPYATVEESEVVSEPQAELSRIDIVVPGLHIVIARVPRHSGVVAPTAPVVPRRRPKVHVEVLGLVHIGDTERACAPSNLYIVNRPGNILGRPDHLIVVPVRGRVEISQVLAVHLLVTVDEVREEWILFN